MAETLDVVVYIAQFDQKSKPCRIATDPWLVPGDAHGEN
jgi:hypothetical protein